MVEQRLLEMVVSEGVEAAIPSEDLFEGNLHMKEWEVDARVLDD